MVFETWGDANGIHSNHEPDGLREQHQGQMQQMLGDAVRPSKPRKRKWGLGLSALQNATLAPHRYGRFRPTCPFVKEGRATRVDRARVAPRRP